LVESGIVETLIHGLTIYSLQMLYGSTPTQSVIFCEKTPIFTSGNGDVLMNLNVLDAWYSGINNTIYVASCAIIC
jgi:hypothetical protein